MFSLVSVVAGGVDALTPERHWDALVAAHGGRKPLSRMTQMVVTQRLPWARLTVAPTLPDLTVSGLYAGHPQLSWLACLQHGNFWPPEPPAVRASGDPDHWGVLTLPTAAYEIGPVEVWFER